MRLVHVRIEREFGLLAGWTTVVASVGLCAIGVVIGRFQRWNSWDLVTRPDAVMARTLEWVLSPLAYVQSTGVAVAVAAFFGLAYLTIWALGGLALTAKDSPRASTQHSCHEDLDVDAHRVGNDHGHRRGRADRPR
jgi:uncharacterized membrane protein